MLWLGHEFLFRPLLSIPIPLDVNSAGIDQYAANQKWISKYRISKCIHKSRAILHKCESPVYSQACHQNAGAANACTGRSEHCPARGSMHLTQGIMDGDNAPILVVDDDDANRYARTRLLRQAGYRVSEAMTGAEALHRAITERPYLVCLDVKLPDINGIEVCRQIKNSPAMLGTLVLQVSAAFVSDEDKIHGLDGGADAYLVLPVEPRELLAIVRALLRIRQTEQALRESEERYRLAARATNDAIWDWDLETNTVRWNEAMIELFGWIEPNNCTTIEWWEDRVHPAERSRVVEEVRAVANDPEKAHWRGEY